MSTPKKAKEINFTVLLQAIKDCLVDKRGIRSTAKEHGLDKSTLQRYVKKVEENYTDLTAVKDDILLVFLRDSGTKTPTNQVFSRDQEEKLVQYITKCIKQNCVLSVDELKQLAYQFAVKLGLDYPPSWNEESKAGSGWYRMFTKRNRKLTLRIPGQTSNNRVKAFCKQNVDKFFENLGKLINEHNLDGNSIFNMDEYGFSTVSTQIGKVICLKGMRKVGKREDAQCGTMVTLALTVCANGNSIPPFFLFPRKKMQSEFLDNVWAGTVGYANDSGWMCPPEFHQYVNHFVKYVRPSPDRPVLLLVDNHAFDMSAMTLDFAAANGVHILSFPPRCSHRLQPLDVSVLGAVKAYYKTQCSAWQKNNAKKVFEMRHVAGLVCNTLDLALTLKIIKTGFLATGIAPFNPDIFSDADYVQDVEENTQSALLNADILEDWQGRNVFITGDEMDGSELCSLLSVPKISLGTSSSIYDKIDPLQAATPKNPPNRERESTQSAELTFPECIVDLTEETATSSAKRVKTEISTTCVVCLRQLPKKLTSANSIACNVCRRLAHLKCAGVRASFYTCEHCDFEDN